MRLLTWSWTAVIGTGLLAACGGTTASSPTEPDASNEPDGAMGRHDAAADTGKGHDTGADAGLDSPVLPPPADGPFACGASTCTATQFCLVPCDPIAVEAPVCAPTGTTCPAGSTASGDSCDGGMTCSFGPAGLQATCVDTPPCTPQTDVCEVQGRTYTETGCA